MNATVRRLAERCAAVAAMLLLTSQAFADGLPGSLKDERSRYSDSWWKDVKFSGHIEAGYTFNTVDNWARDQASNLTFPKIQWAANAPDLVRERINVGAKLPRSRQRSPHAH